MLMNIDQNKLESMTVGTLKPVTPHDLRREEGIFFVGGELPVNETLETMYESFCTESTELFYLCFGNREMFYRGAEMASQIKKNFHVRLMARIDYPAPAQISEHVYAAGVDLIDIPLTVFDPLRAFDRGFNNQGVHDALLSARSVFPSWSVCSTLLIGTEPPDSTISGIDALLNEGIVPLVTLSGNVAGMESGSIAAVFRHLVSAWQRHNVPLKPFIPLINSLTPLVPFEQAGLIRGLIGRFQERRMMAAADLRRHLRVKPAENSLDSASL